MEDAKIDAIAREVLTSLKKGRADGTAKPPIKAAAAATHPPAPLPIHPSLHLLSVKGGVVGLPCVIEPDDLCVGSLRCRSFGH